MAVAVCAAGNVLIYGRPVRKKVVGARIANMLH